MEACWHHAQEARLAQNLSRKSLAQMAGVSESTIKRFESNGQITLDALVLIATAHGATRQAPSSTPSCDTGGLPLSKATIA
ncbi:helix-turn-helix domain-containing protein [Metapseudomonas furukawaii]|uniref:helix-turn-helix domain-containing protein n=2 Tax=Metapseudomonas furukawaii TaxID=1149133 RepID=UPI0022AAA829|nr:helix-turn-helix transcriptional regulator [Pseudomonas furukawaii]